MSLLVPQTDEEKLLLKIGQAIGEPVTISIFDYYPDEKRIKFVFPDNWRIMLDTPITELSNEITYDDFISMVKHIRADQLRSKKGEQ